MVGLRVMLDLVVGRKSGGGNWDEIYRKLHRDAVSRQVAGSRQDLRQAVAVRPRLRHHDLMLLLLLLLLVLLRLLLLVLDYRLRLLLRFLFLGVFLLWSFGSVFVVDALNVLPEAKQNIVENLIMLHEMVKE